MCGKLFGYARVSVASDADANNLENQRRVLADCEQVFEDAESGASWNRPGLNRHSPNPPMDTDGRRENSGRGVREFQAR